jgi:hypothetical protein
MALIKCPECGREVSDAAASCPGCGYPIAQQPTLQPILQPAQKWSPGVAAVLSLVIPGAGQMYKGSIGGGLLWLLFVVIGYVIMVVPGLILHLICIVNAASGNSTPSSVGLTTSPPQIPEGYRFTTDQAAQAIGVTRGTLQGYIKSGRINVNPDGTIDTPELIRAGFIIRNFPPHSA